MGALVTKQEASLTLVCGSMNAVTPSTFTLRFSPVVKLTQSSPNMSLQTHRGRQALILKSQQLVPPQLLVVVIEMTSLL